MILYLVKCACGVIAVVPVTYASLLETSMKARILYWT